MAQSPIKQHEIQFNAIEFHWLFDLVDQPYGPTSSFQWISSTLKRNSRKEEWAAFTNDMYINKTYLFYIIFFRLSFAAVGWAPRKAEDSCGSTQNNTILHFFFSGRRNWENCLLFCRVGRHSINFIPFLLTQRKVIQLIPFTNFSPRLYWLRFARHMPPWASKEKNDWLIELPILKEQFK